MSDVAVYVLYDRERQRMLMEWRTPPWPPCNLWCFGSGVIEPGETPMYAALRELQEELGVKADVVISLPVVTDELGRQFYAYVIDGWDGELPQTNKDPDTDYPLGWFSLTMLPSVVNDVTRAIHALALDALTGNQFGRAGIQQMVLEAVA